MIWTSILLFSILLLIDIRVSLRLIDDSGEEETGNRLITEETNEMPHPVPQDVNSDPATCCREEN